jgi:hypothetical protein
MLGKYENVIGVDGATKNQGAAEQAQQQFRAQTGTARGSDGRCRLRTLLQEFRYADIVLVGRVWHGFSPSGQD